METKTSIDLDNSLISGAKWMNNSPTWDVGTSSTPMLQWRKQKWSSWNTFQNWNEWKWEWQMTEIEVIHTSELGFKAKQLHTFSVSPTYVGKKTNVPPQQGSSLQVTTRQQQCSLDSVPALPGGIMIQITLRITGRGKKQKQNKTPIPQTLTTPPSYGHKYMKNHPLHPPWQTWGVLYIGEGYNMIQPAWYPPLHDIHSRTERHDSESCGRSVVAWNHARVS